MSTHALGEVPHASESDGTARHSSQQSAVAAQSRLTSLHSRGGRGTLRAQPRLIRGVSRRVVSGRVRSCQVASGRGLRAQPRLTRGASRQVASNLYALQTSSRPAGAPDAMSAKLAATQERSGCVKRG